MSFSELPTQLDLDRAGDDASGACFIYLIYANEPSVYDVCISTIEQHGSHVHRCRSILAMNNDCGRGVFTPCKMTSSRIRLDAIADLFDTRTGRIIPCRVRETLTRKGNRTDDNSSSSPLSMTEQLSAKKMEEYHNGNASHRGCNRSISSFGVIRRVVSVDGIRCRSCTGDSLVQAMLSSLKIMQRE